MGRSGRSDRLLDGFLDESWAALGASPIGWPWNASGRLLAILLIALASTLMATLGSSWAALGRFWATLGDSGAAPATINLGFV